MKNKSVFYLIAGILTAIAFNTVIGLAVSFVTNFESLTCVAVSNGIGVLVNVIRQYEPQANLFNGLALYDGLNREIWLAELMQRMRPNPAWLAEARDLSAYVTNNRINLADAGADPGVIIDYDGVDPIPVANTEDTPLTLDLKRFSTERDQLFDGITVERSYNMRADRTQRHVNTLEEKILRYSATAFAPNSNAALTPVLATSGDVQAGKKKCTLNDIIDLAAAYNNVDAEKLKILVLNPTHLAHLQKEDKELFKAIMPSDPSQPFTLYGFKTYVSSATPIYTDAGVLKPYGSVIEAGDGIASFSFLKEEVGRARGTMKAYVKEDDPDFQSTFLNFMVRFIAVKMRSKYVGAIYSKS